MLLKNVGVPGYVFCTGFAPHFLCTSTGPVSTHRTREREGIEDTADIYIYISFL